MNNDFLFDMETFFTALADKTRLRILNLMRGEEVCVGFFTGALNENQPKISRHLAYLRTAGIVEARRDGKWMHYRIVEPGNHYAARVLHNTLDWLASQESMQKDYENLQSALSLTKAPVKNADASAPNTFAKANINFIEREQLETFLL